MKSTFALGLAAVGLALVVGCAGSATDDTETGSGAQTATTGSSAAQKAPDDRCFVDYSQAAGRCNEEAGDDDAAFTRCLTPVKASLVTCCKNGGSASCADEANLATEAQMKVDDACFVAYSQAAGRCNETAGEDETAFGRCLAPVKATLVNCCKNGGSSSCDESAAATDAEVKVDDTCFVAYSQAAVRCNETAGDDDAKFTACLTPVKATLVSCCKGGGSSSCAADAR